MKNWIKVLPFCLLALMPFVTSCSESDDELEEYPHWQATNETYWQALYAETQQRIAAGDNSWRIIPNYSFVSGDELSNDQYIIIHVKEEGQDSGTPLFTDTVSVHYRGHLLPSTTYTGGYVFDSSYSGELNLQTARPTSFVVSGVVDGFATALQKMHIGDRWDVYIPYALGYGSAESSSTSIPAYSTLLFDLTLVNYWHPGDVVAAQK